VVTNFEAALRVVHAGLAISLVPREVAQGAARELRLVALAEPWAERRFIICYRDGQSLTPAAQLLAEHLASLAEP
jgi:DNA-binding transcriptional LysR family regulator